MFSVDRGRAGPKEESEQAGKSSSQEPKGGTGLRKSKHPQSQLSFLSVNIIDYLETKLVKIIDLDIGQKGKCISIKGYLILELSSHELNQLHSYSMESPQRDYSQYISKLILEFTQ